MTEIRLDNLKIVLYSSIKELPIELSKKFTGYLMQEAGIGSNVSDMDDHLARLFTYVNKDNKADTLEELKNLRFNIFSMITGLRYDTLAFGCLIFSVDEKEITDRSPEGLKDLIEGLSRAGLTNDKVSTILEEVKKNLMPNVVPTSRTFS